MIGRPSLDYHLLYLGVFFFAVALAVALTLKALWPIGACAAVMQVPLITRSLDKPGGLPRRGYVLTNELLFLALAVAALAANAALTA